LLKAGWVQLLGADDQPEPGSNCLTACIEEVLAEEGGSSELRMALGNGQTLCALAETAWLAQQGLKAGDEARVQFHPSFVLLGVPV
jgi:molybdate transport system regulatory protein